MSILPNVTLTEIMPISVYLQPTKSPIVCECVLPPTTAQPTNVATANPTTAHPTTSQPTGQVLLIR